MTDRMTKAERVRAFGEVFTPPHIVADMCDMLARENPAIFDPERTFLEPTCGDGAFVLEILRRKFSRCKCRADYTAALKSVYGMELQAENVAACIANVTALCREHFRPTKDDLQVINDHIIMADSLKILRMMADENLRR